MAEENTLESRLELLEEIFNGKKYKIRGDDQI